MPRSMADPNYVYTPRSPEERRKLSLAHKHRLGIPSDCVCIYGIHVPTEREYPLRYYASYLRQKKGMEAAQSFIQLALVRGYARKPTPPKLRIGDRGYVYKPSPQTVRQRIFQLSRGTPLSTTGPRIFGIRVPAARARLVKAYADVAYRRGGLQAARWMVCVLWTEGWPDLPEVEQMRLASRAVVRFARHWNKGPPKPLAKIDWALAELLLEEYASREELAEFFGVNENYLRAKLGERKHSGLSSYGTGRRSRS